jgi:hypothetical protein
LQKWKKKNINTDSEYSKMSFTARNGWKKYVEEVKEDDSRGDEFVSKMVD